MNAITLTAAQKIDRLRLHRRSLAELEAILQAIGKATAAGTQARALANAGERLAAHDRELVECLLRSIDAQRPETWEGSV